MQQDQKLPFSHQRMEPRTLIVRARNEFTRRGALVVHSCPALGGPCRRRFFVLVPEEECRSKGTSGKLEKSVWVFFLCFFCFRVCVCFFSYCVCVVILCYFQCIPCVILLRVFVGGSFRIAEPMSNVLSI